MLAEGCGIPRGKDATTEVPRGAIMLLPGCLAERVGCFSGALRERRTYFVSTERVPLCTVFLQNNQTCLKPT